MAEIPGVKITGRLVPTDTTDTYSATSELYHHGGYKSVADESERLAITSDRRKEGMLVYQLDTKDYWTLEGGILDIHWKTTIPNITETYGLTKTNYLKTSNLLDTSVWTLNLIDPITITETTEEIEYSSCIDNKWYKFTASEYFTATVPYHVYNQFKTGINKLYTFTTYLRGSFEAYDWSFDIYTTTGDLVKHFDVNHNTQHISNVELDANTNYIFGIQYLIYGVGAPSSFYVGDVGLYAAEGQTTNHNTLLNRDAAGNHKVIRPLENSTTSFQHQNASGSSIINIDSVNNEIMFGGGATTRKVDIVINGELKHQQWYEQSKAHTALVTSGPHTFFKTAFQMYMGNQSSALFTKVYLNDVELVFGTDWVWGTNAYWEGSNLKYFDSVEIITPATGTYKVTYYEILSNYKPDFAMSRSDNVIVKNKIPPRQFHAKIDITPVWQKMNGYTRLSSYSHAVSYWSTSGTPMVKIYNYSDMLYCKNFPKNASLGSWTLEVFKVGTHYTSNTSGEGLGTGSGMCFVKQLTTNNFAFPTLESRGYPNQHQNKIKGIYKFRLHNIATNEITEFWDRSLIFRMIVLKSMSNVAPNFFNQFLGRILVPRIV